MKRIERSIRALKVVAALAAALAVALEPAVAQSRPPAVKAPTKSTSHDKPPEPRRLQVTSAMLREAGVAVQAGAEPGFRNKCYGDITVSDQLLGQMRAKGFTLETLCLGLMSTWVQYHVETGRPLTIATTTRAVPGGDPDLRTRGVTVLLDIPNCLRNGTPYLDCTFNFEWDSGERVSDGGAGMRERGRKIDEAIKHVIARGGYRHACQCPDLELDQNLTTLLDNKGRRTTRAEPRFRVKPDRYCYMDVLPACAQQISNGMVRAGRLWFELGSNDLAKMLSKTPDSIGTLNEDFDISPRLPRGYAYFILSPEGDDDQPYYAISPGQRIGVMTE
jgi:hypothetical protein